MTDENNPAPETHVTVRWRVFEDTTHGYWGIEEDIFDGNTILYPKKLSRETVEGIVRAHNVALSAGTPSPGTYVVRAVWDEIGIALALLSEEDASPKARALIREALESATGCKAPRYLGGSATPYNSGEAQ